MSKEKALGTEESSPHDPESCFTCQIRHGAYESLHTAIGEMVNMAAMAAGGISPKDGPAAAQAARTAVLLGAMQALADVAIQCVDEDGDPQAGKTALVDAFGDVLDEVIVALSEKRGTPTATESVH